MSKVCQSCRKELAPQFRLCPSCGSRALGMARSAYTDPRKTSMGVIAGSATAAPVPPVGVAPPVTTSMPLASAWVRAAALAIDLFVVSMLQVAGAYVINFVMPQGLVGEAFGASRLVSVLIFWCYCLFLESGPQRVTLGQMALRLRACDEAGHPLSLGRAGLRTAALAAPYAVGLELVVGLAVIDFFMVAFGPRRQALHDVLTSTLVVHSDGGVHRG